MKKKAEAPAPTISNKRLYFPVVLVLTVGLVIIVGAVWLQVKRGGALSWTGPGQVLVFGILVIAVSVLMLRWIKREQRREVLKAQWLATLPRIPKLGKGKLPPAERFRVYDLDKQSLLGTLARAQLQLLIDAYKTWGIGENDFLVLDETIDAIAKKGGDADLLALLKKALGRRASVEMRWTSDPESNTAASK
jgi:hypothetical protein